MDYAYQRLGPQDLQGFRAMLALFAEAFADPEAYLAHPPSDAYVSALLAHDHFIAIVATAGSEVVGALAAYELQKFEQERREIYLYDLAVAEAHRRRGVATGLINNLRQVARERGAYVIFVQADQGDEPAIRLYQSLGAREDVHHFDIQV